MPPFAGHLLGIAPDLGEGDEVILPGYPCVMDVNPIKYLGARAVFVDIEAVTYKINPLRIEAKITPSAASARHRI